MPQLTNITVNDGETTPIAHVFKPALIDKMNVARWRNSNGVPIGDELLSISIRQDGSIFKSRAVLVYPTVVNETINGVVVPRVARSIKFDVQMTCSEASTAQERKNAKAMVMNLLGSSQTFVNSVLIDLESPY